MTVTDAHVRTPGLLRAYASALRDEPAARTYLFASLVDDVGIAVSAWGVRLLMTDLFTDQRARARLMMPMLACFLVGSIAAGPLADWARHGSSAALARWRWRLVAWGRVIETLALGVAIVGVASGRVTVGRVLPYFLISAFMKTCLRPTRIAFQVDLLHREEAQVDAHGAPLYDERGVPKHYKVHLLSFTAMTSLLRTVATFAGLLLGGQVLALVHGSYVPLFAFDVVTNVGFVVLLIRGCHPERGLRAFTWREVLRDPESGGPGGVRVQALLAGRSILAAGLREFVTSLRDAVQFLRHPAQRSLCGLLIGAWVVEIVNEFYDGRMIVRHTLHGSGDAVRYAEIVWSLAEILVLALIPALARRVGSLGKIFLLTMLLDGIAIVVAGRIAAVGVAASLVPFVAVLAMDRGLTATSGALVELAQNSASGAEIRGRIAASYAFVVILSDMAAERASTALAESHGIPWMLQRVGLAQVAIMVVVALVGGVGLWRFGLRSTEALVPPEIEDAKAS